MNGGTITLNNFQLWLRICVTHENITLKPTIYKLMVVSSQLNLTTIIQVFDANHEVKSKRSHELYNKIISTFNLL